MAKWSMSVDESGMQRFGFIHRVLSAVDDLVTWVRGSKRRLEVLLELPTAGGEYCMSSQMEKNS